MMTTGEVLTQGARLMQAGNFPQAVEQFRYALQLDPGNADAHCLLGAAQIGLRQPAEAVESFRRATQLRPVHAESHCNLGVSLAMLGRHAEAVPCYEEALRLQPAHAEARRNLGLAYSELGRLDEAEECLREALRLKPGYPEAINNLGNLLRRRGRLDESVATFLEALRVRPQFPEACNNLGNALQKQGKLREAVERYDEAIRLRPTYAMAHYNASHALLLQGELARGWVEYEWRWKCPGFTPVTFRQPMWDGSLLNGRTIFLTAEQGLGDTLHFVRYAERVKQRGGRVLFACPRPLVPLLRRCRGIDEIHPEGSNLPHFDVHAPLVSLPLLTGTTTLDTIPATVPYLIPDETLVAAWRERLGTKRDFTIGIAWQGDPKHREDALRSVPLAAFAPLAAVPGVRLISLQKGPGSEQLDALGDRFPVERLPGSVDEAAGPFMDTAAVMKHLDLVVACDSALAHLAGGLGVPVWVAVPRVPDWRWMLDRDDSPWYPTMRLFRQTEWGDWDGVFRRIADALGERMAGAGPIRVEVAPGELIDKITILEIKSARMTDEAKLRNVRHELEVLNGARAAHVPPSAEMERLTNELRAVNEQLWDVEDALRDCERAQEFGPHFVELARSVYHHNDRRAALKKQINRLLGSRIVEEKSYRDYGAGAAGA